MMFFSQHRKLLEGGFPFLVLCGIRTRGQRGSSGPPRGVGTAGETGVSAVIIPLLAQEGRPRELRNDYFSVRKKGLLACFWTDCDLLPKGVTSATRLFEASIGASDGLFTFA